MFRQRKNKGQSTLEYLALLLFVISAMFVFQKYMSRGVTGRLKGVGDSLGQGRIYDPNFTQECVYDYQYTDQWIDGDCFTDLCEDECLRVTASPGDCTSCINAKCLRAECDV